MATRTSSSMNQSAKPVAIAVAVIALLVLVGWLAYASFGPPKAPPMSKEVQGRHDWIASLAKQSGGDINKLSATDRDKLQAMTGGHGAQALKGMASE